MFCTNCGAFNQDDLEFCKNCSESLREVHMEELFQSRTSGMRSIFKKMNFPLSLFKPTFNHVVSLKIMGFLYGLSLLSAGLITLTLIIVGFHFSPWVGIFSLVIGGPIIFLTIVISSRVFLETVLVIFRMGDHLAEINERKIEEKPELKESIQWNV